MVEPHIMNALRNKRLEVAGLVSDLEQRLLLHRADLSHLDATMRLFGPDIRPGEHPSKRLGASVIGFRHGECLRLVYDALRDAPHPITTRASSQ